MATEQQYFAKHTGEDESLRIAGIERLYDSFTRERLIAAGLRPKVRCLEVGAGAGSVARMMGEVSGIRAVAIDVDVRLLEHGDPRFEVRQVDITSPDALEGERFDLIHCRFLLMHMPDPAAIVRRLVSLLAGGGSLAVEEPDMLTWRTVEPDSEGAQAVDRVVQASLRVVHAQRVWHSSLGPRLPALFEAAGLRDIQCEGRCWITPDGSPEIQALTLQTLRLIAQRGMAAGAVSDEDLRRALAAAEGPDLHQITPTLFGTTGRL